VKEALNITVSQNARTIDELYVKPISFAQGVESLLDQWRARLPHDWDEQNKWKTMQFMFYYIIVNLFIFLEVLIW